MRMRIATITRERKDREGHNAVEEKPQTEMGQRIHSNTTSRALYCEQNAIVSFTAEGIVGCGKEDVWNSRYFFTLVEDELLIIIWRLKLKLNARCIF